MDKRLILPVVTFLLLLITGTNSLSEGIEKHETWRIVVACLAIGLSVIAAVIGCIGLYRNRRRA